MLSTEDRIHYDNFYKQFIDGEMPTKKKGFSDNELENYKEKIKTDPIIKKINVTKFQDGQEKTVGSLYVFKNPNNISTYTFEHELLKQIKKDFNEQFGKLYSRVYHTNDGDDELKQGDMDKYVELRGCDLNKKDTEGQAVPAVELSISAFKTKIQDNCQDIIRYLFDKNIDILLEIKNDVEIKQFSNNDINITPVRQGTGKQENRDKILSWLAQLIIKGTIKSIWITKNMAIDVYVSELHRLASSDPGIKNIAEIDLGGNKHQRSKSPGSVPSTNQKTQSGNTPHNATTPEPTQVNNEAANVLPNNSGEKSGNPLHNNKVMTGDTSEPTTGNNDKTVVVTNSPEEQTSENSPHNAAATAATSGSTTGNNGSGVENPLPNKAEEPPPPTNTPDPTEPENDDVEQNDHNQSHGNENAEPTENSSTEEANAISLQKYGNLIELFEGIKKIIEHMREYKKDKNNNVEQIIKQLGIAIKKLEDKKSRVEENIGKPKTQQEQPPRQVRRRKLRGGPPKPIGGLKKPGAGLELVGGGKKRKTIRMKKQKNRQNQTHKKKHKKTQNNKQKQKRRQNRTLKKK